MFEWTNEKIEFLKNNFYTMRRKELYEALGCDSDSCHGQE